MFEVLAFVYENYWSGQACPEWDHLQRKLNAVGFERDEIAQAMAWLGGLSLAAHGTPYGEDSDHHAFQGITLPPTQQPPGTPGAGDSLEIADATGKVMVAVASATVPTTAEPAAQSIGSLRVYSVTEQDHLGVECLGFVSFLETAQVLPPLMREIVMDRALAAPGHPMLLDDLKIIVLMVYWSFGQEPDALVLDELCDDASDRVAH